MKFAKELEQDAVPEWRDKYLNYKAGKKKLKAVARALRGVERPPQSPEEERKSPFASLRDAPVYSLFNRERQEPAARTGNVDSRDSDTPLMPARSRSEAYAGSLRLQGDNASDSPAFRPIPVNERSPLRAPKKHTDTPQMTRYGSIIGSPPMHAAIVRQNAAPSLELPDPALTLTPFSSAHRSSEQAPRDDEYDRPRSPGSPDTITPQPPLTQLAHTGSAYEIRKAVDGPPGGLLAERYRSILQPRRTNSSPTAGQPAFLRRLMSTTSSRRVPGGSDVALESYREADFRQAEFFTFLDKELEKIELFYKSKEDEVLERLKVLKDQLHCMRDRRLEEIVAAEIRKASSRGNNGRNDGSAQAFLVSEGDDGEVLANELDDERLSEDLQNEGAAERPGHHPFKASVDYAQAAMGKARTGRVGKTSKAMEQLGTPPLRVNPNVQQDYTRRLVKDNSVAYRVAKRKLKLALAEFYRGLELMKSYALVNRTAFRKINKKFDKTVNAQPKMRFVTDKVQKSHFVTSDTVDTYISLVEDLYARYFERGNHKLAVGKLRARISKAGHYTGSVFRTGVLAAAGLVFGIQGLVYGVQQLLTSPINHSTQVNFLLQIYGGYFLLLLLTGLFVVDTAIFTAYRVNYQFIFEFDNRNMLDWKQLAEMPSYFLFLLGFTIWCNFSSFGGGKMFIYWPVLLLGLSLALLFCPPPLFYSRSRGWFLYSNWRLLLAGVYPVEFRDFFLGDMYCSQTYAMSNIQTFFCLYANSWENTAQCTSGHSRLLGFFQCLPGIWRLLQCLRRYWDTGNVVPHLANGAKYTCTYVTPPALMFYYADPLAASYSTCHSPSSASTTIYTRSRSSSSAPQSTPAIVVSGICTTTGVSRCS